MKPLIVLLCVFVVAALVQNLVLHHNDLAFSGRIGMAAMLAFTGMGHFMYTKGMALMVPDFIPFKKLIIYLTGIFEFVAAITLLIPATQLLTAWLLIVFFIIMLPANIKAAIEKVDYQKGTHDGNGMNYLWFRVPLQLLFIAWTYMSVVLI